MFKNLNDFLNYLKKDCIPPQDLTTVPPSQIKALLAAGVLSENCLNQFMAFQRFGLLTTENLEIFVKYYSEFEPILTLLIEGTFKESIAKEKLKRLFDDYKNVEKDWLSLLDPITQRDVKTQQEARTLVQSKNAAIQSMREKKKTPLEIFQHAIENDDVLLAHTIRPELPTDFLDSLLQFNYLIKTGSVKGHLTNLIFAPRFSLFTPLHIAALRNSNRSVEYLLGLGANIIAFCYVSHSLVGDVFAAAGTLMSDSLRNEFNSQIQCMIYLSHAELSFHGKYEKDPVYKLAMENNRHLIKILNEHYNFCLATPNQEQADHYFKLAIEKDSGMVCAYSNRIKQSREGYQLEKLDDNYLIALLNKLTELENKLSSPIKIGQMIFKRLPTDGKTHSLENPSSASDFQLRL